MLVHRLRDIVLATAIRWSTSIFISIHRVPSRSTNATWSTSSCVADELRVRT